MAYQKTDRHNEVIGLIKTQIHKKLPSEQVPLLDKFVDHYYVSVADEDLNSRNIVDLYGAVLSHWNFLYQRKADEYKIRVFNPKYEQHGWQCLHTVVEVVVPDMPFIVDSVRMCLTRLNLTIHLMINPGQLLFLRDTNGKVKDLQSISLIDKSKKKAKEKNGETLIYAEIDYQTDDKALDQIKEELCGALSDIAITVRDWLPMQQQVKSAISIIEENKNQLDKEESQESVEFLQWIINNNFTFLGYCEYKLNEKNNSLVLVDNSGLGLLSKSHIRGYKNIIEKMPSDELAEHSANSILFIQQLAENSTVHRPSPPYCIFVRIFDDNRKVIGEKRFIGLYTSVAYHSSPNTIPLLRQKVNSVLKASELVENSHAWKNLQNILETYPRDELIQASIYELYQTAISIFQMQERRRIRLFIRRDPFGRFYSCLVFVPRDKFNSELRRRIGEILLTELNADSISFTTNFSESILARIHFIIKYQENDKGKNVNFDVRELEQRLIIAARTWQDDLSDALRDYYGEAKANDYFCEFENAFPASYMENYPAVVAVHDIKHIVELSEKNPMQMSLYRQLESLEGDLQLKLFYHNNPVYLSDILPMLENMGLKVLGEKSHKIIIGKGRVAWVNDFHLQNISNQSINVENIRDLFQEAFAKIWQGEAENDGFNQLVLASGISWRQVSILRCYSKYMRQIGFTFSQQYIEETLGRHPDIAKKLVSLFEGRFDPLSNWQEFNLDEAKAEIEKELESVNSLDEDRIIQRYVDLITATLRTNFFQSIHGKYKNYIAIKIDPTSVPEMPLPKPMYEIFVYSPKVEGVHLRSAKVARGGIRWSDRKEDFRTEILGLMKAQQVKNSVIVPAGAKGGFVAKDLDQNLSRDEMMQEIITRYKIFISGILDLTDNLKGMKVVNPKNTVRYDEDDFYLVVAADKGTATFSDIANTVSLEYGHWLGDAFASGGSRGYDHKKMGITAKGAWESVKRHFLELNIDVQKEAFTVVGIGDMAGDVFGNGMLLSKKIKLVAAFNHLHIFLDPSPDCEKSFVERKRLFELPRSSWADYNPKLISKGGGIYNRSAKSIEITQEVKELLGIKVDRMVPNDLIRAILKAPIDLLFNGGIGTYVKATNERDIDVGDRGNDALRINGCELRSKVVVEGGNLGLTQLGRVEYSLKGGTSFTDFIDNAGGVDCSDHEVNIKILLDAVCANDDITEKQRNSLLVDMTEEVSKLVLRHNYLQARAISWAFYRSKSTIDEYSRFIHYLEREGWLDRTLEFLPGDDLLAERKANGIGLTRPEIAILISYCKIVLKGELLQSDLLEDPYISKVIFAAFPSSLPEKFHKEMKNHRMKREIIATQLSNSITNEMGATFIKRLYDETGALPDSIVKCYMVAREVFDMPGLLTSIEELDGIVSTSVQMDIMTEVVRLLRRVTRWFLRNRRAGLDAEITIKNFKPRVQELFSHLPEYLVGLQRVHFNNVLEKYEEAGISSEVAVKFASVSMMASSVDIIEASCAIDIPVTKVAKTYFLLGSSLKLDWIRQEIAEHNVTNGWDALARSACKDDLDRQQRSITESILLYKADKNIETDAMVNWMKDNRVLVDRWFYMIADLKATKIRDFSMYSVALRELLDLSQASFNRSVM